MSFEQHWTLERRAWPEVIARVRAIADRHDLRFWAHSQGDESITVWVQFPIDGAAELAAGLSDVYSVAEATGELESLEGEVDFEAAGAAGATVTEGVVTRIVEEREEEFRMPAPERYTCMLDIDWDRDAPLVVYSNDENESGRVARDHLVRGRARERARRRVGRPLIGVPHARSTPGSTWVTLQGMRAALLVAVIGFVAASPTRADAQTTAPTWKDAPALIDAATAPVDGELRACVAKLPRLVALPRRVRSPAHPSGCRCLGWVTATSRPKNGAWGRRSRRSSSPQCPPRSSA